MHLHQLVAAVLPGTLAPFWDSYINPGPAVDARSSPLSLAPPSRLSFLLAALYAPLRQFRWVRLQT